MPKSSLEQRIQKAFGVRVGFEGTCFRVVSQRFANRQQVISSAGSTKYGGRFNFKGTFGVLYLSCDVHTCTEEAIRATKVAGFDVAQNLPRTIIGD